MSMERLPGRLVRRILVVGLIAGLTVGNQQGIAAQRVGQKTPPVVALIERGDVVQRVRPYTYCWSYGTSDGGAVGMCADGFPQYPDPATVEAGSKLRLRIRYPAKPSGWSIEAYRAIAERDGRHEPVGPAEEIFFNLRAHRVNGAIRAWDLVFRVDEPLRHYYIDSGGQLRQGDAYYALHVQT